MTTTSIREAAVLIGTFEVGSPEWHTARADGLGGSEIAAVLGLSKWESPFSLWHRKAGRLTELPEAPEMEWGKRLEPVICAKFAEEHPEYHVLSAGTYHHADRAWQIANPDRLCTAADTPGGPAVTRAILETKFALYDDEWGEPGTDEIPPYYLAQTRWYLDVFGVEVCHVAVFIGSAAEYREYTVRADQADQAYLRAQAETFLTTITTGQRPNLDGHSATYQAVRQLHPDIEDIDVDLPPDLALTYIGALRAHTDAETAKREAAARVLDAIGRARRGKHADRVIAMRVPTRGDNPPHLRPARRLTEEFTP